MFDEAVGRLGRTCIVRGNATYGASADHRGPIGGGAGFRDAVANGDFFVTTLDELLEALSCARAGHVIFVDGRAEIDCTERVHIERLVLEVPGGVTLASDRGVGGSDGAIIGSDTFATRPLIRCKGPGVHITGLRLRGPDPKPRLEHHERSFATDRGHKYYYKFPMSDGIATEHDRLTVSNCELAGWSIGAIQLILGRGHHVHHCHIHHNQLNGLGYGVCLNKATALIECNRFNFNRHSIAGTGVPGSGYEARHNIEVGRSLSHCFDMHGGRDRGDGTSIAGDYLHIHHNTFRAPRQAVVIRGVPRKVARVHHNWFCRQHDNSIQQAVYTEGRADVRDNLFGTNSTPRG